MYNLARAIAPRSKPYGRDGAAYFAPLKELLGKDEDTTLTYSVETMGCQMNSAVRKVSKETCLGVKETC
jgi:hypothetical protein